MSRSILSGLRTGSLSASSLVGKNDLGYCVSFESFAFHKLGYTEIGIVLTNFNRIPEVQLVLLEKRLRVKGDCDGHTEGR